MAPSLPRFYLGNVEAGVKELQLILEKSLGQTSALPFTVQCPSVIVVSHYTNGSKVFSKGALKATFTNEFKFDMFELTSLDFVEYIQRPLEDSSTSPLMEPKTEGKKKGNSKRAALLSKKLAQSIPESVVNEFGVSPKTMRLLEVSDVSSKMNELIQYSANTKRRPAESLAAYSQLLRERQPFMRPRQPSIQANPPSMVNNFSTPVLAPALLQPFNQHALMNNVASGGSQSQMRASASPRSIKRRTSVAMSPGESTYMASPTASPAVDDSQPGATDIETSRLGHTIMHKFQGSAPVQGMATGLGLNLVGSPLQAPSSITSPIFAPSTVVSTPSAAATPSTKSSKRVRTASTAPTLTGAGHAGTKGSATGGGNGSTPVRSRKGAGRKDSNAKRKASMTEEASAETVISGAPAGLQEVPSGLNTGGSLLAPSSLIAAGIGGVGGTLHGPSLHQPSMVLNGNLSMNNGPGQNKGSVGMHPYKNGTPSTTTNPNNGPDGNGYFSAVNQQQASMMAGQNGVYHSAVDTASAILSNTTGEGQGP
ncbi:LIM-domain binding protein-domain-containing protein [Gamsiella multidivaricata]|uniref:LIM-domain binding protein-domain-containing protein n=1 Tax=Gamsiella multidivaricata TaxID=101098 RepID=UPI00221E5A21|nr:LIM-domain binding protein-domain-containing protein [Gamsiella multidivaricata]KAI7816941.1 LIM-domain binding protein-domain-containing protein [Gamsiella multidivaricata]